MMKQNEEKLREKLANLFQVRFELHRRLRAVEKEIGTVATALGEFRSKQVQGGKNE